MNYYTEFIRIINTIQLLSMLISFLYFIKKQRERNYIQILYLIGIYIMPIILFDLAFLINYIFYKIIYKYFNNSSFEDYKALDRLDKEVDFEENILH